MLAIAMLAAEAAQVQAEVGNSRNPWCSVNRGRWGCSYYNRAQCEASVSGVGGYCTRNPNYRGRRY
jgi:hypothetical protein